jgi:hypothetical protein
MEEKHTCNKEKDIAMLQAEQKSLREIYSNDIYHMQRQLDDAVDSIKNLIISIDSFKEEIRTSFVPRQTFEDAQERIKELEKFRQWILVKIAFAS